MKRLLSVFLALVAILLPFVSMFCAVVSMPPVYHHTFTASLVDKYERLSGIEGKKLVIVGGSSVAFGYDSELIEKYLDYEVVNFGVYAALGTKVMMDLSLSKIGEGDIVLLAPELSEQTLSLYFNGETMLTACEENPSLLWRLSADDFLSSVSSLYNFGVKKQQRILGAGVAMPDGVYARKNFNKWGDVSYLREANVMPAGYDPSTEIELSADILSEEFVKYVNKYVQKVRNRGAEVYFAYSPMNEASVKCSEEEELAFGEYLASRLDCAVLGDIRDFTSNAGYFYDTNFHLNDVGVTKHTLDILRAYSLEVGIPLTLEETTPEPPAVEVFDSTYDGEDDENMRYFTYELTDFGITLTGLSDIGKAERTLTVPLGYEGRKVTVLGEGMLSGGLTDTLIVPEDSFIFRLDDGIFTDAQYLSHLVMLPMNSDAIMPPVSFGRATDAFVVHIVDGSGYDTQYFWRERHLTFHFDGENYQ